MKWLPLPILVVASACAPQPSTPPPIALQPAETSAPAATQLLPDMPEPDVIALPQQTAQATPGRIELPEPSPHPVVDWRPPPYPAPLAIRPTDHFYFMRPIPSGAVNWPNPRYRYGSTAFGEESIHTGVDLGADRHTPVVAAGDGEVIWVGFGLYGGQNDPTDPYGLAIAIRHYFGHLDQTLFSIYSHLQSTNVWLGQKVEAGEQIGTVGSTGHASGPHLHFEVRLGDNRYFASRNPELWMVPAEGWGVLAGRVQDTWGNDLREHQIRISSVETDEVWDVWTYALGTIKADEAYQENFVISDLPAGPYQVAINFQGRAYTALLYVHPGQTNLLSFKGRWGYSFESDEDTAMSASPPYP